MAISSKSTYFVSASMGINGHKLDAIECRLDIGAQRNLTAKDFTEKNRAVYRQAAGKVHLGSISKSLMNIIWKCVSRIHIGKFLRKAALEIADKLAVNILLETSFIYENIFAIIAQSKSVIPCNCKPVSLLSSKTSKITAKLLQMTN